MKPLIDFVAGRDWNGIANDVIAGLILLAIPALIAIVVAIGRGWKGPAHWFADRAVARLSEVIQEPIREEWHAEIDHGSPRAAFRFAIGIWLRAESISAAVGADIAVERGRTTHRITKGVLVITGRITKPAMYVICVAGGLSFGVWYASVTEHSVWFVPVASAVSASSFLLAWRLPK
jgi:hypothetical protein